MSKNRLLALGGFFFGWTQLICTLSLSFGLLFEASFFCSWFSTQMF